MNIDSGVLVYLVFLAIIVIGNYLKKRKRVKSSSERRTQGRSPGHNSQPQPPDILEWIQDLLEQKKPEVSQPHTADRITLHEDHREKSKNVVPRKRYKVDGSCATVEQQNLQIAGRRLPTSAAMFKTRGDLRRAVIARVVLSPPKSLE